MENYNICRPFVLCADFIPPTSNVDYQWRYLSWGYFDGIRVGDNLFKNNEVDLRRLCSFYQQQGRELDGSYSTQIIYGMRTESQVADREVGITDTEFWEKSDWCNKFPFIFITLIQADKDKGMLMNAWESEVGFENALNHAEDYKAITYLSLDNSDMILAVRSKEYSAGACVIDKIHRGLDLSLEQYFKWKVKYTFTVAAIDKDSIYQEEKANGLSGNVDTAYIYLIEKRAGSVEHVYMKIKDELGNAGVSEERISWKKQSVLGYNDEVIELNDVPWDVFSRLYRQGERGILNHTSSTYKDNLHGVTTIIGLRQKEHQMHVNEENAQSSDLEDAFLCAIMRKKCERMLGYMQQEQSVQNLKRSIYQIINSLQKFERTPFSDYLFLPTALPLNMVLDMAIEIDEPNNKYVKEIMDSEELFTYFYEFIKGLNLYVQNSNRSDRQFIQTPEFNIRIYDIPTKMTAFYNAYIFNLKNYLNKLTGKSEEGDAETDHKSHEYEFLFCPGAASDLHIKEFFKKISATKRLFLVESPENYLFEPKMILIILTHELGHVVGTGVRLREKRTECAKYIICRIACRYMRNGLYGVIGDVSEWSYIDVKKFWNQLEKSLYGQLSDYIDEKAIWRGSVEEGADDNCEDLEKFLQCRKDHSYAVILMLVDSITKLLEKRNDQLWGYLLERDYAYWLGKDPEQAERKKAELKSKVDRLVSDMVSSCSRWNRSNAFDLNQSMEVLFNLFQECLADLICILTLELSLAEYLNMILRNVSRIDVYTELFLRCCMVIFCMRNFHSEGSKRGWYSWGDEDLKKLSQDEKNKDAFQAMMAIKEWQEHYLGNSSVEVDNVQEIKSALGSLHDNKIVDKIAEYLSACVRDFYYYNGIIEIEVLRKELQAAYRQFEKNDVKELVIRMQEYIERYLNELKQKHDKITQNERDNNGEGK